MNLLVDSNFYLMVDGLNLNKCREDRTRTCGLMVPNHPIYQLIYFPKLADVTGVEPAPNCVTGRHLNRLPSHPYLMSEQASNLCLGSQNPTSCQLDDPTILRILLLYSLKSTFASKATLCGL